MRLIDADRFLEYMTDKCDMSAELDPIILGIFRGALKEQPTAYSVDKVVEELNELDVKSITRYKNGNFGNFDGVEYYIKKRDAIETVKNGSVSDDVCEWKMTDIRKVMPYKTSCGNEDLYDNSYKYCPYCGKKIKVVE